MGSTRAGHSNDGSVRPPTRPFLVCLHDVTPAYARETEIMMRDLAPLLGRRLSLGIVPDWHGQWPLAEHPGYCQLLRESSQDLLLHGYCHQRKRGWGLTTWLAEGSDELNGLNPQETRDAIRSGQKVFAEVFGGPARGFVAPAWQLGNVSRPNGNLFGLEYVLGFFAIESAAGRRIPLATWTWDCGRWGWLGHVGHGTGRLLQSLGRGVPALATHPRDVERGFWPRILRLIQEHLEAGYEPTSIAELLQGTDAEVAA